MTLPKTKEHHTSSCLDNCFVDAITTNYRRALNLLSKFNEIKSEVHWNTVLLNWLDRVLRRTGKYISHVTATQWWYTINTNYISTQKFSKTKTLNFCRQMKLLYTNIRTLNLKIGQLTLRFNEPRRNNTDKRKKKNKGISISYKFLVFFVDVVPVLRISLHLEQNIDWGHMWKMFTNCSIGHFVHWGVWNGPEINRIMPYEDLTALDGIGQHRATAILELQEKRLYNRGRHTTIFSRHL